MAATAGNVDDTRADRNVWATVALLLAAAAALRLGYVWAVPRVLDSADSVHYLRAAETIVQGRFFDLDPKIPILYPALTALASFGTHDLEGAGRLVSFLFSSLLIVPVFFLAAELHGRTSARIAGLLVALWPWLIDYGSRVATEATAVFCWMLAVCLFVRGMRGERALGWILGAALAAFALHLARPEGTFVAVGAIGAGVILGWRNPRYDLRRLGMYVATLAALFMVHAAYLRVAIGHWTLNHRVGFIGDQPEGSTVLADLARTVVAMSSDVPAVMLGPVLWALAGAGLALPGTAPRRLRLELAVLYFAALQWLVVIPVLSPAPRYLMAAFVVLSLWAARGIEQSARIISQHTPSRLARLAPLGAAAAFMVFHLAASVGSERLGRDVPRQPWEYKVAGEWMRHHVEPGLIMTRKPQVAFYAGMDSAGPPLDASLAEILDQAERGGFAYLVVDERYTAQMVPALKPLLDPANAPDSLRPLRPDLSPYPNARLVIYEFASRPRLAKENRAGVD